MTMIMIKCAEILSHFLISMKIGEFLISVTNVLGLAPRILFIFCEVILRLWNKHYYTDFAEIKDCFF